MNSNIAVEFDTWFLIAKTLTAIVSGTYKGSNLVNRMIAFLCGLRGWKLRYGDGDDDNDAYANASANDDDCHV